MKVLKISFSKFFKGQAFGYALYENTQNCSDDFEISNLRSALNPNQTRARIYGDENQELV